MKTQTNKTFPIALTHFRGYLNSLGEYQTSTGERLSPEEIVETRGGPILGIPLSEIENYRDDSRASWNVYTPNSDEACATIESFSIGGQETKVKFTDGHAKMIWPFERPPIGVAFEELVKKIVNEIGPPEKSQKHSDKSGIKSFTLPEGAQVSEICISFISDDTVKVQIRDESIKLNYAEIEFKDKRKGSLWDSRWEVLRDDFAQNKGVVDLDAQNTKVDVKMAVYHINKRLAKIFDRDEQYIYYDGKAKTYKTRFGISYNIGGKCDSDQRKQSKEDANTREVDHRLTVERLLKLPKDKKIKEMQLMFDLTKAEVNDLKKKSEQNINTSLRASLDT